MTMGHPFFFFFFGMTAASFLQNSRGFVSWRGHEVWGQGAEDIPPNGRRQRSESGWSYYGRYMDPLSFTFR